MWMSQYMLSIKETDLELKELMEQTDMQKSFWNNSLMEQLNEEWDEISTQSPMRDWLIKPQGLRKLKKLKSIKDWKKKAGIRMNKMKSSGANTTKARKMTHQLGDFSSMV